MQAIFENFGIYAHVPFCSKPCGYCRFYKLRPGEEDIAEYVKACAIEAESLAREGVPEKVDTMFWGGGTPSSLPEGEMERLAEALGRFRPEREWTVEVSPSSAERGKLETLKRIGVTRISLGVQSFDEGVLRSLGRAHSLRDTLEAIDAVAEAGFKNFSIDLIFGAKGQTEKQWRDDLRRAAECPVNHISAYCLEFESGTSCCCGVLGADEIGKREREAGFFEIAMDYLPALGFRQYEISNYAREGGECLHNLSTWHMAQWAGVGPSAASQFGGFRRRNAPNLKKWRLGIENSAPAYEDVVELDDGEMFSSALVFGLRMNDGVDLSVLRSRFPKADFGGREESVKFLESLGLLEASGDRLRLTRAGRLVADSVAVELL